MGYVWLKAIHVISVIAWMAGLLYLPRLFVYHCGVAVGSEASALFKTMERRLLRIILTPGLVFVWITGLSLAFWGGAYKDGWLHAKIALVVALSGFHGFLAQRVRVFSEDKNVNSAGFYRVLNEVPTILMIGVVILAVVKPF